MSWFKVDDGFHDHPKVHALAEHADQRFPLCVAIWTLSGCYAARHGTDGRVTLATLRRLAPGSSRADLERAASDLVTVGLWERDGESYLFHDWADYQPTREQKAAKRDQERDKKARQRGSSRTSPGDARGTRAGHVEVSPRDTNPRPALPSPPDPSPPVPTRPVPAAPSQAREPARAPEGSATGRSHYGNRSADPGPRGSPTEKPKRNPRVGQADPDTNFAGGEVQV